MSTPRSDGKREGEIIPALPANPTYGSGEKGLERSNSDIVHEKYDPSDEQSFEYRSQYRNGKPIITTGEDVSRFSVDIRDDEDDALMFRSMFLGTLFAGMGAALCQVRSDLRL